MNARRRAALALILVVVVVVVLLVVATTGNSEPAATAVADPGATQPVMPAAASAATAAQAQAANPLPATAPVPVESGQAPERVLDLCGIGRIPVRTRAVPGGLDELPSHLLDEPLGEQRQQMIRALSEGTERMQAAAWLLRGRDARSSLSELALRSSDPVVVRWALTQCGANEAACRRPLAEHWQTLDPANAAAHAAAVNFNASSPLVRAASFATGGHHTLFWGALTAEVAKAPPAHMPPYLRQALVFEALGVEMAFPEASFMGLSQACRKPDLRDADGAYLARLCGMAAELLVGHSDTLMAHGLGLGLGERAGWPAARVAQERQQIRAAANTVSLLAFTSDQPRSCAAVEQTLAWAQDLGRLGEMGLARRQMAASAPR